MIEPIRKTKNEVLFISWASFCSRSDSIAKRLGGTWRMICSLFWGNRYSTILFKYLSQTAKTLGMLFYERPRAVLVMSPPVIACFPVWLYSRISRIPYLVDAHTAAFVDERWQSTMLLHRFFSRKAAATIVTNSHLESIVRSWGAKPVMVADVPVCFAEPTTEYGRVPIIWCL